MGAGQAFQFDWDRLAEVDVVCISYEFVHDSGNHDLDGDLLRLDELGDQVFAHVVSAVRITNGVRLTFDNRLDPQVRNEWIELGRLFYPDVSRVLVDDATVDLSGPPVFVHGIEQQFTAILKPQTPEPDSNPDGFQPHPS